MFLVRVLVPFHRKETDTVQVIGDEIEVSEEELARIRAVNVNMVLLLGETEAEAEAEAEPEAETEKPKRKPKKQ